LDDNVPAKVLRDGTFRAEMIKGGFKVSAKDSGAGYHVTKTASETVFAFDAASVHAFRISDAYRSVLGCKQNQYDDWDVTKKKSKLSPAQRQRVVKARAESVGECAATLFTSDIENDFDDAAVVPVDAMKIDLSVRAFEGVVYYLGEVVRAETTDLKPTHGYDGYYPTIVARTRWGEHSQSNEPLFVVKKGSGSGEVAIAVKDDKGNNYWIPGFCTEFDNRFPVPDNCATEYPNHESLTVLTLLNQLWGLQKEPSVAPTRTITVGGG
jgi:hypothetical protein